MDFNFTPHHCVPLKKDYNVLRTEMEGMKVKTRLKSTRPLRAWELEFRIQNNNERLAYLGHWDNQYGICVPFNWLSVPDYISTESSIYVRYISYKEELIVNNVWIITVQFEEAL